VRSVLIKEYFNRIHHLDIMSPVTMPGDIKLPEEDLL
jgi:hypothetical protein